MQGHRDRQRVGLSTENPAAEEMAKLQPHDSSLEAM